MTCVVSGFHLSYHLQYVEYKKQNKNNNNNNKRFGYIFDNTG